MPISAKGCITRRRLIALSALAAGGAQAAPKIKKASKKVAGYIEKEEASTQNCSQCHFYLDPLECMLVEGPINPWGWCNYYAD